MTEQWQELKETITELRYNDGTGTQQEVCEFLANLMDVLEKQVQDPKTGHWIQTNEFFINQDGKFIYKNICSECKSLSYFRKKNKKAIGANVCPNCGTKMVEPQESEVAE